MGTLRRDFALAAGLLTLQAMSGCGGEVVDGRLQGAKGGSSGVMASAGGGTTASGGATQSTGGTAATDTGGSAGVCPGLPYSPPDACTGTAAAADIAVARQTCELPVPPPPTGLASLSYDLLQLILTPSVGGREELPYATNGACNGTYGGWYYDVLPSVTSTPSRIILCPCTCNGLARGTLEVYLACRVGPGGLN
jgi:hypothetical protein